MVITGVLCLCAAVVTGGLGLWLLTRPSSGDPVRRALRAVAPTQLAAAVMLGAGGAVALAAPREIAVVALIVCIIGAIATVAAGCWQSAKAAARQEPAAGCGAACGSCTLSCSRAGADTPS